MSVSAPTEKRLRYATWSERLQLLGGRQGYTECPDCGKKKWKPFIDTITGQLVPQFGSCERTNNCGAEIFPNRDSFRAYMLELERNGVVTEWPKRERKKEKPYEPPTFLTIDKSVMAKSVADWHKTNLGNFLIDVYGYEAAQHVCQLYNVGAEPPVKSNPSTLRTAFWYVDQRGVVLNAKTVEYNVRGRRYHPSKEEEDAPDFDPRDSWFRWKAKDGYGRCLFGQHLLAQHPAWPVGLVESEKSAVIAHLCIKDEIIWLATGSATTNCSYEAAAFYLKGRQVALVSDCDKAGRKGFAGLASCLQAKKVPIQLRDINPSRMDGYDLADYLLENRVPAHLFSNNPYHFQDQ